jgi:hypothetical protein
MDLKDLAAKIVANMIPQSHLTEDDRAVLTRHADYLTGLTEDIVTTFSEAACSHPATAAVLEEEERPAWEQTLRDWWTRTVTRPIDDDYYAWMTRVGVTHVRRRVGNPMMLGMLGYLTDHVSDRAREDLDPISATDLARTLGRLQNMVGALISDSCTRSYIASLEGMVGFAPELTERMLDIEIKRLAETFPSSF